MLFRSKEYLDIKGPYALVKHKFYEESDEENPPIHFRGVVSNDNKEYEVDGIGNGPIDAFFKAIRKIGIKDFKFVSYSEHAISEGEDSKAVAYIQLTQPSGEDIFGVGTSHNINVASIRGVLCAINRSIIKSKK